MRNVDDSISPQVNFCSYIGFSGASIQLEKSKSTISWKYCISKLIGPIYGKRWINIIISYKISNVLPIMKWKSTLYKVQKLVLIGLFYWFYWHRYNILFQDSLGRVKIIMKRLSINCSIKSINQSNCLIFQVSPFFFPHYLLPIAVRMNEYFPGKISIIQHSAIIQGSYR